MKRRIAAIIIAATAASLASFLWFEMPRLASEPSVTTEFSETLQEGIRLKLVESGAMHLEVEPGEAFDYNVSLHNYGKEPARVFIRVTNPVMTGAVLTDGSTDPTFINYKVSDAWTKVDSDVYMYNDVLDGGETTTPLFAETIFPDLDFTAVGGKVMTGSVPISSISDYRISAQGYAIMSSMEGSPEELWNLANSMKKL